MASLIFDLLIWPVEWVLDKFFNMVLWRKTSTNPPDDPDYQANVQRLIERNREFEKYK